MPHTIYLYIKEDLPPGTWVQKVNKQGRVIETFDGYHHMVHGLKAVVRWTHYRGVPLKLSETTVDTKYLKIIKPLYE